MKDRELLKSQMDFCQMLGSAALDHAESLVGKNPKAQDLFRADELYRLSSSYFEKNWELVMEYAALYPHDEWANGEPHEREDRGFPILVVVLVFGVGFVLLYFFHLLGWING